LTGINPYDPWLTALCDPGQIVAAFGRQYLVRLADGSEMACPPARRAKRHAATL
jgi:hypothetical protein